MNRREAIASLAAGAGVLAADRALAGAPRPSSTSRARPGNAPSPRPLPFDPKKLRGLSEKLITSHHDHNYAGAVKNLAKVREELAATTRSTPAFVVGALRERELLYFGSMTLHEIYFDCLGGDGKPGGAVARALPPRWEEELRATAMSLGGGSGWATLSMSLHTGELFVGWSGNHTQSLASSTPLLALDMYEHAYAMDYGASHPKYIDAFLSNVRWDEVDRRHQRALAAHAALKQA